MEREDTGLQVTAHAVAHIVEVPRCSLLVLGGSRRGQQIDIDADVFRIGKAAANHLVLDEETVSRSHCEIRRDGKSYLVRDLGSTNGTLLDGAPVREAYLTPGATLTVGNVELRVRPYAERIELLPSEQSRFGETVGHSTKMREIFGLLERLAPTDATVLIGGETGTGKDVLARSIHAVSRRAQSPFIVVDCGAVVGTLIESELFGHEKGAFTGAMQQRAGAFELAQGGTVFLDEIGELPLDLQPKLLRVLEQRTIRRVGGTRETPVDIRVVAASKRNLKLEVERGKFREDLYFRLAVVPLELPPLRERREDIALLSEHLVHKLNESTPGELPLRLTADVMATLRGHDWPGNVRELRNVLERAAYLSRASGQSDLNLASTPLVQLGSSRTSQVPSHSFTPGKSYRDTRAEWEEAFEKRYVRWLLDRHGGNVSAAAREAEMDRKYLHKLAKRHGFR